MKHNEDPVKKGAGSPNDGYLYFETPGMIPGAMEPKGENLDAPAAEAVMKSKKIPSGGVYK